MGALVGGGSRLDSTMSIRITAIRLSGGTQHEHIIRLWWSNPADGSSGDNTRAEIVAFIENDNGKAYVDDSGGHRADVGVVTLRVTPRRVDGKLAHA